ncbi:MAG: radical SAM family heme chaperone HemW, partial [Myxococcota bacterium]
MGTGLYVHVPYCRRRCPYCDFNVWVDSKAPWEHLAEAIICDLESRAPSYPARFDSVYFGGGTPSLAPTLFFESVLDAAQRLGPIAPGAEVTVEIEPDTVGRERLREWRTLGFNRASLGWQSTHDSLLRTLGRGHSARSSQRMVDDVRDAGFENVSVDLIFAVPGQSLQQLDQDLDAVVGLAPPHVSLYALTFEPNTEFERRRQQGRLLPVDEPSELEMMDHITSRLTAAGFAHYEVSNYAQPGYEARHNSSYWAGKPYLGVGPGAHSYLPNPLGASRWESRRNPGAYIATQDFEWQEALSLR